MVTGSKGVELIAQERFRQKEEEGFDAEHDYDHTDGELAIVAACYAVHGLIQDEEGGATSYLEVNRLFTGHLEGDVEDPFPWANKDFDNRGKVDRKKLLVQAGALIAAELDRLETQENKPDTDG